MGKLKWTPEFSVNNDILDEQHKHLFDAYNKFVVSFEKGHSCDILEEVLDAMVKYTEEHFAYEEKFMKMSNFPNYIPHKSAHDAFFIKVYKFRAGLKKKKSVTCQDLIKFLENWLTKHVKEADKEYSDYFKTKAIAIK